MLRVLIVEDEIGIYQLIKDLIAWETLNLELSGYARDGAKAFDMIMETQPDIVITDISMPSMSGLELLERVQDYHLTTKFIIISGYNHFEYAVKALKFGVEDYLLKPISRDEINNVLEKVIYKLDHLDQQSESNRTAPNSLRQRIQLRDAFILQQIYDQSASKELALQNINEEYCYHFQEGLFQIGVVFLDFNEQINVGVQSITLKQLMRIFENHLSNKCFDFHSYEKNNHFLFLLNYKLDQSASIFHSLSYALEETMSFLSEHNHIPATLCLGDAFLRPALLSVSAQHAYQLIPARILLGAGRMFRADQLLAEEIPSKSLNIINALKKLHNYGEIKDRRGIDQTLHEIFAYTTEFVSDYPQLFIQYLEEASFSVLSEVHRLGVLTQDITVYYRQICDLIQSCATKEHLEQQFVSFFSAFLTDTPQEHDPSNAKLIQIALQYIQENYRQNLKLEDIAEVVYLAPSYFGILFKKATGVTFSSYITTLRINQAKELLKDIKYNISEIAEHIGYQNNRYFSRVFKDNVGITPKEYRKLHHNKPY